MDAQKEEVASFLKEAKSLISDGKILLVRRSVNLQDIADIGLTFDGCTKELLSLTIEDYSSGPEPDRDYPGEIWIFGKLILGYEVYIKLKIDRAEQFKQATCISFHIAEYPLKYPYKE